MKTVIRAIIIDDHSIFREGLKRLLNETGEISVQGEARDGAEALKRLREEAFDVALLDINMPGRSGLDFIPPILSAQPSLPIVVLSMYPAEQYAMRAFEAGAKAYINKDMDARELIKSIRKVVQGGRYLSSEIAELMLTNVGQIQGRVLHQDLSSREYEIMLLIVKGVRLTEIGKQMFLSVKTVSTYRARIMKKIGVLTNAELVQYALRHRLID